MNATNRASTRRNNAKTSRLEARSWYRTKRKSGRLEAVTMYSGEENALPLTVATTLKYRAPAPDGMEKPFAVYDWWVWPDCAPVALASRPETVPQMTWASVPATPVGPRSDHLSPNGALGETDLGNAFTEMDRWLRT